MLSDPNANISAREPSVYNYIWPVYVKAVSNDITGGNSENGWIVLGQNDEGEMKCKIDIIYKIDLQKLLDSTTLMTIIQQFC